MTEKIRWLADEPKPSVRRAMLEFADLYRGGPDGVRGNATECYLKVRPRASRETARKRGGEYLHHPLVQEYLHQKTAAICEQADVTQEMVLNELRKLAFFDIRKLYNDDGSPRSIGDLDDDTAAAITGLDAVNVGSGDEVGQVLKYKLADKKGALELFGKHLKLWTDKSEVTVNGGKSLADLVKQARDESE